MIGMVHMRLADLEGETRRLLRAASIVGDIFWAGCIAHLTGERPAAVATRIDDLVARELLTRRATTAFPGDHELAFRHGLVREVAYATLTDDDRILGHRLAGEWLESAGAHDPSMLASHFERGNDPARATIWYQRAAEAALEVNDFDGAIERANRGLALHPEPSVETSLRYATGRAHRWKGELENAGVELQRVFDSLEPGTRQWFTAGAELANVIARRGRLDVASSVIGTMLATPCTSTADATIVTIALARAAHVISYPQLMPNAESALRAAQLQAERSDVREPSAIGQLRSAEWAYAMATGSFAEALLASREALRIFESIGDLRTMVVEHSSLLVSLCDLGLFEEVVAHAPAALDRAARLGLQFSVALTRICFGRALMALGELPRARREMEASAAWLEPRTPIESWARAYLSQCAVAEGALDDAEFQARRAVERGRELPHTLAISLACLALVEIRRGRASDAVRLVDEALSRVDAAAGVPVGDALVRRLYVEVHEGAGNHEASKRQVATAAAKFRERAARIADPAWKQAFLAARDQRLILQRERDGV